MTRRWGICGAAVVAAILFSAVAAPTRAAPASVDPTREFAAAREALEHWTSPALARFQSEAQIRQWLNVAREAERAIPSDGEQALLMIGDRQGPRAPAPLGIPEVGVDRGDVIRQVGRFLLILHNGYIYSIDTRGGVGRDLALADRVSPGGPSYTLYDEMLVHGDRVIVTGYNSRARRVFVSVMRLGEDGRLTRESSFLTSSASDYDTAIAGANLVIYGSTDLSYWGGSNPDFEWPVVRLWDPQAADSADSPFSDQEELDDPSSAEISRGAGPARPLFAPEDVYRPVASTLNAELHFVTICPIGSGGSGGGLSCRTTGLAGSIFGRFHVTVTDAFLFLSRTHREETLVDEAAAVAGERSPPPALLYRVPLSNGLPEVMAVAGSPPLWSDLIVWEGQIALVLDSAMLGCPASDEVSALFRAPLTAFAPELRPIDARYHVPLPDLNADEVVSAGTHAVVFTGISYGGGSDEGEIVLVPLRSPTESMALSLPHDVLNVEPGSGGLFVTGRDADDRLSASFVSLGSTPSLTSVVLGGYTAAARERYVSAWAPHGRGGAVIGLPAEQIDQGDGRRSSASGPDIIFLYVNGDGSIRRLGALPGRNDAGGPGSAGICDPPCHPWRGLSRAIFVEDRIFALAGADLIEARIDNRRVVEVQRLDVAAVDPTR